MYMLSRWGTNGLMKKKTFRLSSDCIEWGRYLIDTRTGRAFEKSSSLKIENGFVYKTPENEKIVRELCKRGILSNPEYNKAKRFFHLQWHLLNECNLRCSHCYDWKEKIAGLTLKQMFRVVDEYVFFLKSLDYQGEISLTGGEPTLFPHLIELIEYIKSREIFIRLSILSNGISFPQKLIPVIKKYNIGIQISLDGLEEVHDKIRGKGSFLKSLNTIKLLIDNKIDTSVHYVLMKKNIQYIENFIKFLDPLGLGRINFSVLVPIGPGAQEEMATPLELKNCYENLIKLQKTVSTPILGSRPLWTLVGRSGVCPVGYKTLTIDASGNLMPCRRWPVVMGNVQEDSIMKIWYTDPFLNKMRNRETYLKKCGQCEKLAECAGCRAVAAAATGDPFEKDPYCWI